MLSEMLILQFLDLQNVVQLDVDIIRNHLKKNVSLKQSVYGKKFSRQCLK